MTALPADITAVLRPNGVSLATQADAAVKAAWPNAIDGSQGPIGGFCDDIADTAMLNAERFALLKAPRLRFSVELEGVVLTALPAAGATAAAALTDAETAVAQTMLVSHVRIDLDAMRTGIEVFG